MLRDTCSFYIQFQRTNFMSSGMGKSQTSKYRGTKLSLDAFLRLELPAPMPAANSTAQLVPFPAELHKRNPSVDSLVLNDDYIRDNPTPIEAHARKTFKGLCFECQMVFATWKHPDGFGIRRESAHHSYKDLDHCWCPLCKMLLNDLIRYNDDALQDLRLPANSIKKSDVKIYHHKRYVPCYYVELIFELDHRRLRPYFMMFVAGEL